MFYYLNGTVAHIEPYLAVIDCGGVGYACRTTSYTLSALKKGDKGKLFTHLNVREDAMELYGFATQEELTLFQQLISVSGVGPKAALSILSASTPANLALSIITGDEKALTCAQGVGKKIAQRVILELKDKLSKGQTISAGGGAQEAVELKTVSPQYLGAVVVCDGADSPQVQLAVTQAVAQFTGLSTDHISVLRKQPDPQSK